MPWSSFIKQLLGLSRRLERVKNRILFDVSILAIHGLKQSVRLGCTEEERVFPQLVSVEMNLELDMSSACKSDSLSDTVDYISIVSCLEDLAREYSWNLLEKLAYDMAGQVLSRFSVIEQAEVIVTKRVTSNTDGFSVAIKRKRFVVSV